jgi:DNA adenine methylase
MSALCKPFLKWPGGKRWAADQIARLVSRHLSEEGTYFEPFLGGGAVYFRLQPLRAVLADVNHELINVYEVVRRNPDAVLTEIRSIRVSSAAYYRLRESRPRGKLSRATKFLYLNRTAWGGIYRLNAQGEFNVPFGGRSTSPLWRNKLIVTASDILQSAELQVADFATTMLQARRGDVVYCDPTYAVAHQADSFVRYNEQNFSWEDQKRLANAAHKAQKRGATVVISNAYDRSVRDLYPAARRKVLKRESTVSRERSGRREVYEYLLTLPALR